MKVPFVYVQANSLAIWSWKKVIIILRTMYHWLFLYSLCSWVPSDVHIQGTAVWPWSSRVFVSRRIPAVLRDAELQVEKGWLVINCLLRLVINCLLIAYWSSQTFFGCLPFLLQVKGDGKTYLWYEGFNTKIQPFFKCQWHPDLFCSVLYHHYTYC